MRKMNASIKLMVSTANTMLASTEVQGNADERAVIQGLVNNVLLNSNMYHGFNWFVKNEFGDLVLAGKETNLVQFYIM